MDEEGADAQGLKRGEERDYIFFLLSSVGRALGC
tara:strand:- start:1033 stop:1134 length:102 start_codon:yes stop_codon:yes gene_type:complete